MALRLARHARRQLRLVRDRHRHRHRQSIDPVVTPVEAPRQETSPLAVLVAHLTHRLSRFQGIYTLITFGCFFAFWFPSVVDSSFRRSLKNARSVDYPLNVSHITKSSIESSTTLVLGFIDEYSFQLLVAGGYAAVAELSVAPHLLLTFRRSIIPLICSSIVGQLVSGLVDRPLDMLTDFRLNSLLVVQIIGFFLCLFSSFIIGVTYASVHQFDAFPKHVVTE